MTHAAVLKGPAGHFTSTDFGRLTGPVWAALANLAIEAWIRPTAIGRIFRIGPTGESTTPGVEIRIEAGGWACTRRTAGGTQTSTGSAAVTMGQDYHLFAVFQSGAANLMYVNGVAIALTHVGANLSGPILASATDELAIGDPTPVDRVGFAGILGRVFFWPFAPSANWVKASYRAQADQIAVLGIGSENLRGTPNRGPVAIPMTAAVTLPNSVDVDVAARAYDPNGNLLTASVPVPPTQGTSSIVAGKVRYIPQGGTGGQLHTVPFRVADAALNSSSIIRVSVSGGVVVPPDPPGTTVKYQTGFASAPASNIISVSSSSALQGALNSAGPGDYVVLENGTYTGNFTLSSAGTTSSKVHVRARNHLQATLTGKLTISAQHTWVTGLEFTYKRSTDAGRDTDYPIIVTNDNVWVTNCYFPAVRSGITFQYERGMTGCKFNYNTLTSGWPSSWAHATMVMCDNLPGDDPGPSNFEWAYNFLLDEVPPASTKERHAFSVQPSQINSSLAVNRSFVMHHNFTRGNFARHMYNKRHGTISYNVSIGSFGQFGFRHGNWNVARGNGGLMEGNYVNGPYIIINGGGAVINGNRHTGDNMRLFNGNDTTPVNQAADNTTVIDHVGSIVVGYDSTNGAYGGTVSGYQNFARGAGGYPIITPISPSDLVNVAGCDTHRATT